jgi:hypothetical protein
VTAFRNRGFNQKNRTTNTKQWQGSYLAALSIPRPKEGVFRSKMDKTTTDPKKTDYLTWFCPCFKRRFFYMAQSLRYFLSKSRISRNSSISSGVAAGAIGAIASSRLRLFKPLMTKNTANETITKLISTLINTP